MLIDFNILIITGLRLLCWDFIGKNDGHDSTYSETKILKKSTNNIYCHICINWAVELL